MISFLQAIFIMAKGQTWGILIVICILILKVRNDHQYQGTPNIIKIFEVYNKCEKLFGVSVLFCLSYLTRILGQECSTILYHF